MSDIMDTSYMGDDMQQCEGDGCEIMFTSNSHNQKYADPRCRKDLDACDGEKVCRYRLESGDFPVETDPLTGDKYDNDYELRAAYNKLVMEYNKV